MTSSASLLSWPPLDKGAGALQSIGAGWKNFCVVTTPSPWALARARMPNPNEVILVENLDRKNLSRMTKRASGVDLIVGLGSGLAMDAAKYLAKMNACALVQVPSTCSNNACFTRTAWTFENGARIPEREAPIPVRIILDDDLLMSAPPAMNRAGTTEILCSHTALFDWKLADKARRDVEWDEELDKSTRDELEALKGFAPAIGANKLEAFVAIMEVGLKFAGGFTRYPKARFNAGSEHIFSWALDETTGKRLIHGETVALGILLMAHIQDNNPDEAAKVIQDAKVNYRPEDLGITWGDVEKTVSALPHYAERVPWYTIIDEFKNRGTEGLRDFAQRFAAAKDFVQRL